jgi:excisionase family DNA binding protein
MTEHSKLISVPEAAGILGIGKSKAWEWVKAGKIKSVKMDGRRLVIRHDLDELINKILEEE